MQQACSHECLLLRASLLLRVGLHTCATQLMPGPEPLGPQALTVPSDEAVLIEYPGFVENPEAALATLGGPGTVAAVLGSDSRASELPLRFRPGDALAHPIAGLRMPASGLLLRVTRCGIGAAALCQSSRCWLAETCVC